MKIRWRGTDAKFFPDVGPSFSLLVCAGQDNKLVGMEAFHVDESEYLFLCQDERIAGAYYEAVLTINGEDFRIVRAKIKPYAQMLVGEPC